MFFKKKKDHNYSIILAMVMLRGENGFTTKKFLADLNVSCNKKIESSSGDDESFAFTIEGEMIVIAHMPIQIPRGDIEGTAQYAYNWKNALTETALHKTHLVVSVMSGSEDQVKRYRLLTLTICALLRTTDAIGVYKGNQSLLLTKTQYLDLADLMDDDHLPLRLWVYLGIRRSSKGMSSYTYGLQEFKKREMEIIDSSKNIDNIQDFLFTMAHYIIKYDVTFNDGETCGLSPEQKISISLSKGVFVEGNTLKLDY
jgi:hypothetical protein